MKKRSTLLLAIGLSFILSGCAHQSIHLWGHKPVRYSIGKVNSQKKYLHMMSRSRGVLGTSNWGKFNYDVVSLPFEKQGEYFIVAWKRSGGPKKLSGDVICRIDYQPQDGPVRKVEKIYSQPKRGVHRFIFENTGDLFVDQGEVKLWKVTLIVDGVVVAQKESKLWWTVGKGQS